MSLHVHRSERSDVLAAALGDLLLAPPEDPFTPDVVAVPTRGVERWLAQTLSARLGVGPGGTDGVCANVLFPSPSDLVGQVVSRSSGLDPREDPWTVGRTTWSLVSLLDECAVEPWCRTLGRHLGVVTGSPQASRRDEPGRGRDVAAARKVAGLFARYAADRPEMVIAWAHGEDTDGTQPLPEDLHWQPHLWRLLRERIGVASPAERLLPACRAVAETPGSVDLPGRLSVFGPTRLSTDESRVLGALAAHREVHLWLPHPSPQVWDAGVALSARTLTAPAADVIAPAPARVEDPSSTCASQPFLRSLGRDSRELQGRLARHLVADTDEHRPADLSAETLLGALQRSVREDASLPSPGVTADGSVSVHACHGRHRQVEVLREVILGLLDDPDLGLEPRDVVVMCPDVEEFAPLLGSVFGALPESETELPAGEPGDLEAGDAPVGHPGHLVRLSIADRGAARSNPLLDLLARLLDLADSRLTTTEVLDLLTVPAVARASRLDEDAVDRITGWIRAGGVRWGADSEHRATWGLEGVRDHTWDRGLDRLLVGVAVDQSEGRLVGGVLPIDDVDSSDVDLAGRFAELVERLVTFCADARARRPLADWVRLLEAVVDDLAEVPAAESVLRAQVGRVLADVSAQAGDLRPDRDLDLGDVRALLGDRLAGRATRTSFRTGRLTVCSLMPMRAVPHRVVCLLGLDEDSFPRTSRIDGDDVLTRTPRSGERDLRAEDRQLFLDAVMSAQDRLVVLYSGFDERTGLERPTAIPVAELLDAAAILTGSGPDDPALLVRHPLQPHDERNFRAGGVLSSAVDDRRPFSFDPHAHAGALAARRRGERLRACHVGVALPIAREGAEAVDLGQLTRFWEHPVKEFLTTALDVRLPGEEETPQDDIPFELNALAKWAVGDALLRARLAGQDREHALAVERARGVLPPGVLGETLLKEAVGQALDIATAVTPYLSEATARSVDLAVDLPCGIRLGGSVTGLHGRTLVRAEFSKLKPKHRLRAWLALLALAAQDPGEWRAVVVGRGASAGTAASVLFAPGADEATALLDTLTRLREAGLRVPLPVAPECTPAYAEAQARVDHPRNSQARVASSLWLQGRQRPFGDGTDAHLRFLGVETLDDLVAVPRDALDPVPDGYPDEPHLFGALARTVWQPLLDAEAAP